MFRRNKTKFVHQLESVDCGPACLAMVASYHGRTYSLRQVKELCSITRMGVSVQDIINGGRELGFQATGVKLTLEQLNQIPLPAILFWKQDHFIVLNEYTERNGKAVYKLSDPGYGRITLDSEMVMKEWMGANDKGVAIILQPGDTEAAIPRYDKSLDKGQYRAFFKPVLAFLKQKKYTYLFTILLMLAGLCTNWVMPLLFRRIIDDGIMSKSLHVVWMLLLAQFILFLSNFIADFVSHWMLTKVNFRLSILLKQNFLHKLMRLPVSYFDTRLNTDTLQRLGDQHTIQSFVTWKGLELVLNTLNLIVFSAILFYINKAIFGVYVVLSIASVIWVSLFLRARAIIEYSMFLRQSENNNSMYEFIMHMPEIKVNEAQHNIIRKILAVQEKLNLLELRSLFLNMYQHVGVGFLSKLKEIIAIALCAYLIIDGRMTLGSLLSISYILGQLAGPVQNMINFVRDTQDADIARKRVNDVFREQDENDTAKKMPPAAIDRITLDSLTFKYPGSFNPFVIQDVSITIPANKITAIVGQSGSGKTTLLKLLLSYYAPTAGSIRLNDEDLTTVNSEHWRKSCGIVMQDGHIFNGTITENIALSDASPNMAKVAYAAEIACIDTFIDTLPLGYNTKVGNVGIQLSGGQKQRLLIARAVYRNPDFLFFDEATSSLDANNERAIMDNLQSFFQGKTVVTIAHRLSTVKNADQIIVMEKGAIAEIGTHEALARTRGKYFELVKNQLELGA